MRNAGVRSVGEAEVQPGNEGLVAWGLGVSVYGECGLGCEGEDGEAGTDSRGD